MIASSLVGCILFLVLSVSRVTRGQDQNFTLGLINGGSSFFDPVGLGWEAYCQRIGVTCYIRRAVGGECADAIASLHELFKEFIALDVSGIAMPPCGNDASLHSPMLDLAEQAGVPVVTFDNDLPNSTRAAYIGTDNEFLGRTMARLLRQLHPQGGTFSIIAPKEDRLAGFLEEISKYNDDENRAHWYDVRGETEYDFTGAGYEEYMIEMEEYALMNTNAMIFMKQTPMRHPNWTQFVDRHRHRDIILIGTDGSDYQLTYLNQLYVDGLVGQLPYEWATVTVDVLLQLAKQNKPLSKTFFPTNLVAYNLIPLELPPLELDENLLGNLVYVGYTCLVIAALFAVTCVLWTYKSGSTLVVKAAQPFFLYMVAGGVILMSMALIPLSFDDGGVDLSEPKAVGICMSIPWLAIIGFTIIFSALFSKTWRTNRLFHANVSHARIKVTEKDVLAPFLVLMLCNIIVLVCWTVIDPLTYVRQENDGTDYWNRAISSYGACRSNDVRPYLIPLAIFNCALVAIACWQAFEARDIKSEFAEGFYIGLAVFSLFQAFLTGLPILVIVKDTPEAFYLVLTLMIFILSMAVLLLIFLPKVILQRNYAAMSDADQRKTFGNSIRFSSQPRMVSSVQQPSSLHLSNGSVNMTRSIQMNSSMQMVRENSSGQMGVNVEEVAALENTSGVSKSSAETPQDM